MEYCKEFKDSYTYYHFDKIYPLKEIYFENRIDNIEWSINNINYYSTKIEVNEKCVTWQNVHLKYLKIKGKNTIEKVLLGDGFIVCEAEKETYVFIRNNGWAGADGVYQHQIQNNIHWYFSDTLIGDVDKITRIRKPGYRMVNNTIGISSVEKPFEIEFFIKEKNGQYDSYFKPKLDGIYWLQDGIYLDNDFYLTVIRVIGNENSFSVVGVETLKIPYKNDKLLVDQYEYIPTNFHLKDEDTIYTFGASILDDRDKSGYIYVFGYDDKKERNAIVSRVKNHIISSEYEYLSEGGWQKEAKILKSIAIDVACEFKVIYYNEEYLISYTKGGIGTGIMIGKTTNISNGFSEISRVYDTSENHFHPTWINYNAKFQIFPKENDLYITYHVNTIKNGEHDDANIYYPRWIKLKRRSGNL